jgi:CubicO group peptidase (beta-lactamase class C family)
MKKYVNQLLLCFCLLALTINLLTAQPALYFPTSTPEAEGVSSTAIIEFIDQLEKEIDAVHSFMILRHGKVISQGWWDPYGPEIPHTMHSLSKSFTSTAIGFAIQEELISLDDLVISFFPEKVPENPGWHWNEMRIRDLLTMNTGHIREPRPGKNDEDWIRIFLESDVELMPGTHFLYNSMATYMLSAIIQKVTGEKLVDYLDNRFFQPLKIKKPEWDICPKGINTGGWGLHIVTEDIAKLGQLYLQKGKWEGRQLLSEEWVEMATSKQVSNGSNPDNDWTQGYGFQFWRCRHNCYRGDGAMSQFCIVMPEQNAVLAITSGAHDMARVMNIVWEILLPAMAAEELSEDPTSLSKLNKRTGDLELKPIIGKSNSSISKIISGKKYKIEQNQLDVKSVSFHVDGKDHQINIEMEHGTEAIQIGSAEYTKSEVNKHLPCTDSLSTFMAVSGAWTKPDEYKVRIYLYKTPARITYTFSFKDGKLFWDSNLEYEIFGRRNFEQLKGIEEDL